MTQLPLNFPETLKDADGDKSREVLEKLSKQFGIEE